MGLVISRKVGASFTVGEARITVTGWGYKPGTHQVKQVKLLIEAPPEVHIERDDCVSRAPRVRHTTPGGRILYDAESILEVDSDRRGGKKLDTG